jgi:glycogen debranching enzyme
MILAREICRDFARSSKLEWLETNGTGAFSMGTVAGVNTRRYHALLTASLNPPVERFVLLARVEEELQTQDGTAALGACQYPGTVAPRGFEFLEQFEDQPCATWRFCACGVTLEKQVYLVEGRQAMVVRYRASQPAMLRVRPFLAYRDYHSLARANSALDPRVEGSEGSIHIRPYSGLPPLEFRFTGCFANDPHWYYNNEYLEELDRGLEYHEDLFSPGVLKLYLRPGEWSAVCASVDGSGPCDPVTKKRDPFLIRRANGQPSIIAGYPWFTDWGRDTMISLPGLLISKGDLETARSIIDNFLAYVNNGLLPNRFPDAGQLPEYNTADATLWMFQAMRYWLGAGGDRAFLRDVFYPEAREIVDWHERGTSYNIHVDCEDHLLVAGGPGSQLTWMDARIGGHVVTPRHGKPVEINALWHSALMLMAEWARELGDDAQSARYAAGGGQVRDSFQRAFWNESAQCLHDVIAPDGPVAKLRPNQIFAVSLPHALLEPSQKQAIVRAVERDLLTPVGLRTLAPGDPDYRGRYQGSPWERDTAYHQGTVWPWLLGSYIDAYLNAFGNTQESRGYCRGLIDRLESEAARSGCIGSIAEIYDGDEPRYPKGCPAQAWSVAEIARVKWQYGL